MTVGHSDRSKLCVSLAIAFAVIVRIASAFINSTADIPPEGSSKLANTLIQQVRFITESTYDAG